MSKSFGSYVRSRRLRLHAADKGISLRALARAAGVEPSYLSKIERGLQAPPSETTIARLAEALGEDPDILLALAGKISSDLQTIILKRPVLMGSLIRRAKTMSGAAIRRLAQRQNR